MQLFSAYIDNNAETSWVSLMKYLMAAMREDWHACMNMRCMGCMYNRSVPATACAVIVQSFGPPVLKTNVLYVPVQPYVAIAPSMMFC